MDSSKAYSARAVFNGMKDTLHSYLEAQYHVWDEGLIEQRRQLLEAEGVTFQEPRIEATPTYASGEHYSKLAIPASARHVLDLAAGHPTTGIPASPYRHQATCLEAFLGSGADVIVATGTGSGKTECFLMPILGSLAVEAESRPSSWVEPGFRALLLYPMNALVNDQVSRLRKLLGNPAVAEHLRGSRGGRATFGMYTSRTPYPGTPTKAKDKARLGDAVHRAFLDLPADARGILQAEGKWPAKNLEQFVASGFTTQADDSELFSRGEMQRRCPDILVTNYSMLEYMLLRPIEQQIFEQTANWLRCDKENFLTVVLDEAHMYRGSAGAEVAYLLRRLHARLGLPRDRVRYILTSASLGGTAQAAEHMKSFAADLTGVAGEGKRFVLVRGNQVQKPDERTATSAEASALASFDVSALQDVAIAPDKACDAFTHLLTQLGVSPVPSPKTEAELRSAVFNWLQSFGPAAQTANLATTRPAPLRDLAPLVFPSADEERAALESMLALMSFARESETGRVYAPIRAHMFFRGLPGIYACVNSACPHRERGSSSVLGRMYASPQLHCLCGSRVYELLTHRDCGAAFLRGYVGDQDGSFLWHQPSTGLWGSGGMVEAHFLVEVGRRAVANGQMEGARCWLHKPSGRIVGDAPSDASASEFLPLLRPDGLVRIGSRDTLSFRQECPVCTRRWQQGSTKIMDLATKGEAPFAQLIRTQVDLQPPTRPKTDRTPNAGRKSLLFSDGRQKAARLARDIPREIENDVFRQLLLLAAVELNNIRREATLGTGLYVAMLRVLAKTSLSLFDGADREQLQRDVQDHRKNYLDDFNDALQELPGRVPPRFSSLLLRHLGSPFYSLSALTLAHLQPSARARRRVVEALPEFSEELLRRVWVPWLQSFAGEFAVDPDLPQGVRSQAAGYPVLSGQSKEGGLTARQRDFLRQRVPGIDSVFDVLSEEICQPGHGTPGRFLVPRYVMIDVAEDDVDWYQCGQCASVSPVDWWGHCPRCLSDALTAVRPGATSYLRARKAFFRDPVVEVLKGLSTPFNLVVEEHTAQLNYRDIEDDASTVEDYERRFRDILVRPTDTSVDVLSSTTTMEVGVDIGSLVAVGLRNVPPLRQNYQQRAGRAGRRGSAVSTVVTYAQNSPHDSYYFEHPEPIIAGEPTLPGVDTDNPKIIERHIRAQLLQAFFQDQQHTGANGDIFSVLGETMSFYGGDGPFTLHSLRNWLAGQQADKVHGSILGWLPASYKRAPSAVGREFVSRLDEIRPSREEDLEPAEGKLIEFLFAHGFLPAYAFPRDLCALQIEELVREGKYTKPKILQRPQQGLNVALSEYAPGRFVVVDKKTYRVGTVAAHGASSVIDRASRLFADVRYYTHCPTCQFSPGLGDDTWAGQTCPLCAADALVVAKVIEPQVVFPDGGKEVDEFDDEQTFTNATSAQLSLPDGGEHLDFQPWGAHGELAFARDQQLVMVNKGEEGSDGRYVGFMICSSCGRCEPDAQRRGAHKRDYLVQGGSPSRCTGEFEPVYLGYGFASDVLVMRLPMAAPLRFDPVSANQRTPAADGLQSLAEALVLGISQELDIDIREISAGYRFLRRGNDHFADLFVYDTLAGGAGYATQAGHVFASVATRAEALLSGCDCSSSCEKCLRHYANRFHHASLDRFLAIDMLRFVRDGFIPIGPSIDEQRQVLRPLEAMLNLAGWSSKRDSPRVPIVVTRDGRAVELFSYPSLIAPRHYGHEEGPDRRAFSSFELSRDLPGAFESIA